MKEQMYTPTHTREQLLGTKLKGLRKLNYNPFTWWRMYESTNKPLSSRAHISDKIKNGDYDYPHWKYQAELCEHDLNDMWQKMSPDYAKWVEESSLMRARRKRLIEDHEKEENKKLEELVREFTRYYRVTKEQVLDLMLEWEGDLYGFYQFMDDQYRIKPAPIPKF
jgi:hypothetical protein